MEGSFIPPNPWAFVSKARTPSQAQCTLGCDDCPKGAVFGLKDAGRLFNFKTGEFWANTTENDGTTTGDETCPPGGTTENCY